MASLQKNGKNYYLKFCDTSRTPSQKRFSLRTPRKKTAEAIQRKLEDGYMIGDYDPWTESFQDYLSGGKKAKPLGFAEAKEAFIQSRIDQGCTEGTVSTYETIFSFLDRPTTECLKAVIWRKDLAQATKLKRYRTFNTFFRWQVKHGHIKTSPLDSVPKPKEHRKMPKAVSPAQLTKIAEKMKDDYRQKRKYIKPREIIWRIPLFWFGLYTGLRASELARLKWEHIDFEHGVIRIYRQKNRQESTTALSDKARAAIKGLKREGDFVFTSPGDNGEGRDAQSFVRNTSRAFRKYRKAAGLGPNLSLHGLRHGAATLLAQAGCSAVQIKAFMRHQAISTSQKYIHLAANDIRSAANSAFG